MQLGGTAPSSAAEVQPSQSRPVTGGEITASQNQESEAAVIGSIAQPAVDKQATEATGNDWPPSQCPAAEEQPALRAAADEGTNTDTGMVRPGSKVSEKAASQRAQSSSK